MATNKLRIGDVTPSKLYIGDTEVTKVYMGETLVYEKSLSSGETWLLNETVIDELGDSFNPIVIDFVSNGTNYVSLFDERRCLYYNMASGQQILVYDDNSIGWKNEAYRTITFANAPTGDLLTWLQANGVKQ